ncbi:MAG: hypothetical protein P4L99_16065 [Chthoniobacter sp.]|nr:hypothetical protein [Chthoniobacter sp.]
MPTPTETVDASSGFQDRKTGLVVFGILTALMGGLCALLIPLIFFSQSMAARSGVPQNTQVLWSVVPIYGGLAVMLIWLGIGSMMARRWARALLLILSWTGLIIGVISIVFMAFAMPQILASTHAAGQPELSASANSIVMVVMMIVMGVIYVVLPGTWLLFYRSRHVKATCEAYDPVARWTDRCPLPVIAVCLWLGFSSASMLLMAALYKGVFPLFGNFVVGPLGSVIYILTALLWGYCAWAFYKLEQRGWWIVVVTLCLFAMSAFLTYSRHDPLELYTLMGYPEQQIAQIQKLGFLKGQTMAWFSLGAMVPFLGYLIYLRRFFPRPGSSTEDLQHR